MKPRKKWTYKAMLFVVSILVMVCLARADETMSQKPAVQTTSAETVPTTAAETASSSQQQPEHHSLSLNKLPDWLYSYNLFLMRIGFYNRKSGGLLNLGLCNNDRHSRYHMNFQIFPDNFLEVGLVNLADSQACIRLGVANMGSDLGLPGLNIGLYNQTWGWQIGGIGNGHGSLQVNVINYGSSFLQLGAVNTSKSDGGRYEQWQLGCLNMKTHQAKRNACQIGAMNLAAGNHDTQMGFVNIAYEQGSNVQAHNDQVGLLNFTSRQNVRQLGLINIIRDEYARWDKHWGLLNIGIRPPYVFPFCFVPWDF